MKLKPIHIPRGYDGVHVEFEGGVVNINRGLRDDAGRDVVRISVDTDGDRYSGDKQWWCPDLAERGLDAAGIGVRLVQMDKKPIVRSQDDLMENVSAISSSMFCDGRYDAFQDKYSDRLDGEIGVHRFIIEAARALFAADKPEVWLEVDWYLTIDEFVSAIFNQSMDKSLPGETELAEMAKAAIAKCRD